MRRTVIAIALILAPVLVVAGATWSADTSVARAGTRVVKATSATGTETAPTAATAGIDLRGLKSYDVYVESSYGALTAGRLAAYAQNPVTSSWAIDPEFDLTVSGETRKAFVNREVHSGMTRISFEPSGLGTTAVIYIVGTPR